MGLDIYGRAKHRQIADLDVDAREYYFWGGEWSDREAGAPDYPHEAEEVAHAGMSYGGYFCFRQVLASTYLSVIIPDGSDELTDPADTEDPLWKFICYADNEGVFGPPMVKRVAKRLAELDRDLLPGDWRNALDRWRRVFEEAAKYEDGCVEWA